MGYRRELPRNAKKCKKNAKKCNKVLHISKKSSTFVADLGIVPDRTFKHYRVMEKVEVLKVDCKPRKVRIYRVDLKHDESIFVVYEERKRVDYPCIFGNYYEALKRCMIVALGNMGYVNMTEAKL